MREKRYTQHFSETLALRNSIFLHAVRNWQFAPVFTAQRNNSIVCSLYFRLTAHAQVLYYETLPMKK